MLSTRVAILYAFYLDRILHMFIISLYISNQHLKLIVLVWFLRFTNIPQHFTKMYYIIIYYYIINIAIHYYYYTYHL